MGKRCFYDLDVQDAFGLFGLEVAVYFEVLRFRQQLFENNFFTYTAEEITRNCGLSYKQQIRARNVLEATDWIEVRRSNNGLCFRLTKISKEAIKYTPHRQRMNSLQRKRQNLVNKKT